ncbi:hypothetical protein [Labrenzia sp. VG12]|uniref:hypothetical protein n=1 Tax=Labrenzia sp. VG12 TaxID=2021862 RepID=UPI0012FD1F1C|nr:hypothetical protein [Labrenzia sp. VG12]
MLSAYFLHEITGSKLTILLIPAAGYFCGWTIRRKVQTAFGGPIEDGVLFYFFPSISNVTRRWPMLLFDVWTLGISFSIGALAAFNLPN